MVKTELCVVSAKNYSRTLAHIIKAKRGTIICVAANRPHEHSISELGKPKIFYIDCISKRVGAKVREDKGCVFVDGPQALTSISIAISEAVNVIGGQKTVLLDSISALLRHNDLTTVCRFVAMIMNKMRVLSIDTIFMVLRDDYNTGPIKAIAASCDEVKYG